jgi:predicted acetyltransferase
MTAAKLVKPSSDFKDSYLEALKEFHQEGRYTYNKTPELSADFEAFIQNLNADRGEPHQPLQEWVEPVPETVLWMVKDMNYLGTVDIRHRLNWHLEKWGGHLHCVLRPSMRGKGFGRKMLLKAIPFINYLGIEKALITVNPNNNIAIRIIESCGAIFEDELPETKRFPARRRYWLDCS